ncbi:GSCFA domain-containing protein [Labrenzia sp. VG12]|uniref:GSCFA domain-containing protein n=1 Tax=Labrenzia sp. VG12 TaxID=2021862 RepID=UPI000B8BB765|nr:GSCFA domain-containing protein [Labrenzia sp. VG12]ASP35877.1 hypothetical protein CHH27_23695 [Labrenzia sp. VG12]
MASGSVKLSVLEKHGFSGIRRWPNKNKLYSKEAVENFYLHGFVPKKPFIKKEHKITAFGSCFAGNVSKYLHGHGFNVNAHTWKHADSDFIRIDEIMVHTPALRMQFEWAFENKEIGRIFVGGAEEKAKTYHELEDIKALVTQSDVYIITFGLTEAWFDREENTYLWKFIPHKKLDPERYINKSVSFSENLENIEAIYKCIREVRPDASIIMTLSPIPLLGTYSNRSIVAANSVSKAKLRAALDEFISLKSVDENLFYFPSYELVTQYLEDPWEDDNRHITKEAVNSIMQVFDEHFLIREEGPRKEQGA